MKTLNTNLVSAAAKKSTNTTDHNNGEWFAQTKACLGLPNCSQGMFT
jgi:hypothetical protein